MGKNKHNYIYRDLSKKGSGVSGQLCFDTSGNSGKFFETKEMKCSEEASKYYWNALKRFLDESGSFSRTWSLYKSLRDVDDNIPDSKLPPETVKRLNTMRDRHNCKTIHELRQKVEREKYEYRRKLDVLLDRAADAGVGYNLSSDPERNKEIKNEILNAFVVLTPPIYGKYRRMYFRDKYLTPATRNLERYHYSDPIHLLDMEKAFEKDGEWLNKKIQRDENNHNEKKVGKDPKT